MPIANVHGINISYEIIGDGSSTVVITPGGRSSKDAPGIRHLAEDLSKRGLRALIWDRPNCGESDISFSGISESHLCADTLAGLIKILELNSVILAGASGGARISLLTAIKYPNQVDGLFLWWITGGAAGLSALAHYGYGESVVTAVIGGMDAVSKMPAWNEQLERNSGNRERLLKQPVSKFIETMQQWGWSCLPTEDSPVPGILASELACLNTPTAIIQNSRLDPYHTFETSKKLVELMPRTSLVDSPWGEAEFAQRLINRSKEGGLFANSAQLGPSILSFAKSLEK